METEGGDVSSPWSNTLRVVSNENSVQDVTSFLLTPSPTPPLLFWAGRIRDDLRGASRDVDISIKVIISEYINSLTACLSDETRISRTTVVISVAKILDVDWLTLLVSASDSWSNLLMRDNEGSRTFLSVGPVCTNLSGGFDLETEVKLWRLLGFWISSQQQAFFLLLFFFLSKWLLLLLCCHLGPSSSSSSSPSSWRDVFFFSSSSFCFYFFFFFI